MTDPLEHLRWHEWARDAWTEKRIEPLELTGAEIAMFISEHEVDITWTPATSRTLRIVTLTSDDFPVMKGLSLHQAAGKAAAWLREVDE